MTLFQWVSISLLLALFAREIVGIWRGSALVSSQGLRAGVWLSAAFAIFCPDFVTRFANFMGIDRGADFVFYLFVLAFLGVSFDFYSRFVRMQRQFTQMVRHLAIQEAKHGGGSGGSEEGVSHKIKPMGLDTVREFSGSPLH